MNFLVDTKGKISGMQQFHKLSDDLKGMRKMRSKNPSGAQPILYMYCSLHGKSTETHLAVYSVSMPATRQPFLTILQATVPRVGRGLRRGGLFDRITLALAKFASQRLQIGWYPGTPARNAAKSSAVVRRAFSMRSIDHRDSLCSRRSVGNNDIVNSFLEIIL